MRIHILLCILFSGLLPLKTCQADNLEIPRISDILVSEGNFTQAEKHYLEILSLNLKEDLASHNPILQKTALNEFEILRGHNKPEFNLLARIDRTETFFGYLELAKKLISPTDNIKKLRKNQAIIREIVKNKELFEQLDKMVKAFRTVEPLFAMLWNFEKDDGTKNRYKKCKLDVFRECTFNYLISERALGLLPKKLREKIIPQSVLDEYDKKPLFLEPLPYVFLQQQLIFMLTSLAYSEHIPSLIKNTIDNWNAGMPITRMFRTFFQRLGEVPEDGPDNRSFLKKCRTFAMNTLSPLMTIFSLSALAQTLKELYNSIWQTHDDYIKIGTFLNRTLDETDNMLQDNTLLQKTFSQLREIHKITKNTTTIKDLHKLLELLKTKTFTNGTPSVFFSRKGRMLAAYTLFESIRDSFIPLFSTIGKLDAYLSLAKLYKERSANARYCFARYRKQTGFPKLVIKDFWNPFVDQEKVVTNSLEPESGGKSRCYIFTGPNAGGKSTAMKAIGINILMAQTCGIVPAKHLEFTPFSYIDSHVTSVDDIAAQKSRYVSEATRVKDIINNLKTNKFSYLEIDEPFDSTNSESGSSIVRAIGRFIAYHTPNCICIIASHLADVTNLEKDTNNIFTNYKVTVEKQTITDEDGNEKTKIHYPYKLEPGIADQSIAIEILDELGFDQEIVEDSQWFYEEKTGIRTFKSGTEPLHSPLSPEQPHQPLSP